METLMIHKFNNLLIHDFIFNFAISATPRAEAVNIYQTVGQKLHCFRKSTTNFRNCNGRIRS